MYPAPFEYHCPSDLKEALELLCSLGDDARCLAGGQSLIPAMKLRLTQPAHLLDLSKLKALRGVVVDGRELVIGAMTTHREVEASPIVQSLLPSLAKAASLVADPQVRNRGTIGGSLAYGDPSSDYSANVLALDATMVCAGLGGEREVTSGNWFESLLATAIRGDEILTQIRFPLLDDGAAASYVKVPHPASHFAIIGAAALVAVDGSGSCSKIRIGVTGLSETAERGAPAEAALKGSLLTHEEIAAASRILAEFLPLQGDLLLEEPSKRYLCALTVARAIREAGDQARTRRPTAPDLAQNDGLAG